jgi:predicted Zn finger-like uncharacterized protein
MLVARCPNCNAKFRVLPDTLNQRQGKVRCGECMHVFNAFQTLSREPDPPPHTVAPPPAPSASTTAAPPVRAALPDPVPEPHPAPPQWAATSPLLAPIPVPTLVPDTAAVPAQPTVSATAPPTPAPVTPPAAAIPPPVASGLPLRLAQGPAPQPQSRPPIGAEATPPGPPPARSDTRAITIKLATIAETSESDPPGSLPIVVPLSTVAAAVSPAAAPVQPAPLQPDVALPPMRSKSANNPAQSSGPTSDAMRMDQKLREEVASTSLPDLVRASAVGTRTGGFKAYVPPPEAAAEYPLEPPADVTPSRGVVIDDKGEIWVEEPTPQASAAGIAKRMEESKTAIAGNPVVALPLPSAPSPTAVVDHLNGTRQPTSARLWVFGSVLLILLGALQLTYWKRTEIATQYPEARPWLELACEQVSCTVPWTNDSKALDLVVNEFREDPREKGQFLLSATLRHRGTHTQELPLISIKLTNNSNQAVVQRLIRPAEYLGRPLSQGEVFAPGATLILQLKLEALKANATGYEIDAVYDTRR